MGLTETTLRYSPGRWRTTTISPRLGPFCVTLCLWEIESARLPINMSPGPVGMDPEHTPLREMRIGCRSRVVEERTKAKAVLLSPFPRTTKVSFCAEYLITALVTRKRV